MSSQYGHIHVLKQDLPQSTTHVGPRNWIFILASQLVEIELWLKLFWLRPRTPFFMGRANLKCPTLRLLPVEWPLIVRKDQGKMLDMDSNLHYSPYKPWLWYTFHEYYVNNKTQFTLLVEHTWILIHFTKIYCDK